MRPTHPIREEERMFGGTLAELVANEFDSILSVILGLVFIVWGVGMILNSRRHRPKLDEDAAQASRRRSASL